MFLLKTGVLENERKQSVFKGKEICINTVYATASDYVEQRMNGDWRAEVVIHRENGSIYAIVKRRKTV
jgi:hypothetical protein